MSDWWNRPGNLAQPEPVTRSDRVCPWCSAVAPMDSSTCPSCGAIMAQRESLAGLVIPGVTSIDQDLVEPSLAGSLIRSQTRINTLNAIGQTGGTGVQLAAAAGYLVKDSLGGILTEPAAPAEVGRPSQAALEMARQLDGETAETHAEVGEQLDGETAETHAEVGGQLDGETAETHAEVGGQLDGETAETHAEVGGQLDGETAETHAEVGGQLDGETAADPSVEG